MKVTTQQSVRKRTINNTYLDPPSYQLQQSPILDSVFEHPIEPFVFYRIEELANVQIQYPVHLSFDYAARQCVERIMLASLWPESVGETFKVSLIYLIDHSYYRLLRDLVLYTLNTKRSFGSIVGI